MPPKREPEYRVVDEQEVGAALGLHYDEAVWLPGAEELERIWPDGRSEWALRLPACYLVERDAPDG